MGISKEFKVAKKRFWNVRWDTGKKKKDQKAQQVQPQQPGQAQPEPEQKPTAAQMREQMRAMKPIGQPLVRITPKFHKLR